MNEAILDLSTSRMQLVFHAAEEQLHLALYEAGAAHWLAAGAHSSLFSVTIDGRRYGGHQLLYNGFREEASSAGLRHVVLRFVGQGFQVEQQIKVYADSTVLEFCPVIRNTGVVPITIERVDSIALNLAAEGAELFSYTGNWGSEFEPQHRPLEGEVLLQSRSGRSSKGNHPWFALSAAGQGVFSGAVAWSGNWALRFEPLDGQGCRLSGGLNDWMFAKVLQPGESMDGAPVVLVLGEDLNDVSQQYARVGRKHWYPRNSISSTAPIEWNHWWPYEDAEINEDVFARNVARAEPMGFEVCTLDAGWFGPADAGTFWEHFRGDWHRVNEERFPSGIRSLADQVHALGMKFGIWCEIEGLGERAQVAIDHPEYVALRDGTRLGYMCFGNQQVQEWAYGTLTRLINAYGADWIKVDYNLDAGAGCNRADHGHQAGDGLYEHIRGYYATLERVRRDYPEVVLENCSSGGLRIDLGMLRRTDMTFLSDPDWPEHDLQIFWGASTMLAPDVLLHWTFSDWRNLNPPRQQNFNPRDPNLTQKKWEYYSRISMLGLYGLSQKLPDLPDWLAKRVVEQNAIYKNHVRHYVLQADLYRLTGQPRRTGEGERWPAFQYSLPDGSSHLLFVFRMPGAEAERVIRLQNLLPDRRYTVRGLEGEWDQQATGRQLMEEGLRFSALEEQDSALLEIA